MLRIDSAILVTSYNICKNIDKFDASERGLLSQNILGQLRNFIEYIAEKVYSKGEDIDPNSYQQKVKALEYVKSRGNYRFLSKFHDLLQKSSSHYTFDEDISERLMLKYYEYLLRIKIFLKDTYNIEVLKNIDSFPINTDSKLKEYYEKIADRIDQGKIIASRITYDDRYYIQKIKPFFVKQKIYYEVTFSTANDKVSKFDRVIAFTNLDISDNYAVKLSIRNDNINIMGKTMPVQIIESWAVSIRPCEINHFADFFGINKKHNSGTLEYRELMSFLTVGKMSLVELVESRDEYYFSIKSQIMQRAKTSHIFDILDECKKIIKSNSPGSNILRYLLLKLNNKVEKQQYSNDICERLSNLYVEYGCIPFDKMPYCSSLIGHNPKLSDLFECIKTDGREHEFLARAVKNNTEKNNVLYTPKKDIKEFNDIDELMNKYNNRLYSKHMHRRLEEYKNHIYIKGYVDDSVEIIENLRELSTSGINNYSNSVEDWLESTSYKIDCEEKENALKQMFEDSRVALIYGSAGTGKSTLINHISNFFNTKRKIYLANTNPAVDNLRRKVNASNCTFRTIASFLYKGNYDTECDLLIIDECSTVSNFEMRDILRKATFKLLVLVGDVFQIESILFGNWFSIARSFIPKKSIIELTKPYRSTNSNLLNVWSKVRNIDDDMLEVLVSNNYSAKFDESIFEPSKDDQIILCLNYDGLYGINNINRFLQGNNTNPRVQWGINVYKIGDPILFNESERFAPLIYNNLKGKIVNIKLFEDKIQFDIEIEKAINELDTEGYGFRLIDTSEKGKSVISFFVSKYPSTDEDDNLPFEAVVPFQVAYAISIHKAQGLEYDTVKVIITDEIDELITHNIFYTAITRAKENLKIYWTPETEKKILNNFKLRDSKIDVHLLSAKYKLEQFPLKETKQQTYELLAN